MDEEEKTKEEERKRKSSAGPGVIRWGLEWTGEQEKREPDQDGLDSWTGMVSRGFGSVEDHRWHRGPSSGMEKRDKCSRERLRSNRLLQWRLPPSTVCIHPRGKKKKMEIGAKVKQ